MLPKDSLNVTPYEHFSKYYESRGVGIISDNQFAFYTQKNINDGFNHDTALPTLDNLMYPDKKYRGFYRACDDVVIVSSFETIIIELPRSNVLTRNQKEIIEIFIKEVNHVMNDFPKKELTITITTNTDSITYTKDDNLFEFIKKINDYYNKSCENKLKYISDFDEKIVGLSIDNAILRFKQNEDKINKLQQEKRELRMKQPDKILKMVELLKNTNYVGNKKEYFQKYKDICDLIKEYIFNSSSIEELNEFKEKIYPDLFNAKIFDNNLTYFLETYIDYMKDELKAQDSKHKI